MVDVRIMLKPDIDEELKDNIEYTVKKSFKKYGIEMQKHGDEMVFACKNPQREQQYCSMVMIRLLLQDWFVDNTLSAIYNVADECIDLMDEVEDIRKRLG